MASGGVKFFARSSLRHRLQQLLTKKPVFAAVAYVSNVSNLPLGKGDRLVCDASDNHARTGATRRDALTQLRKKGVSVWSYEGLHAKVVVADDSALVGSANWSASSEQLAEAGMETTDADIALAARNFVKRLIDRGALRVNKAFLDRMPDPSPRPHGGPAMQDTRYWLISTGELKRTRRNEKAVKRADQITETLAGGRTHEHEIGYILFGESDIVAARVHVDDQFVEICADNPKRVTVYALSRVIEVMHNAGHRGIFHRITHRDERRKIGWTAFFQLAKVADLPSNIGKSSTRELTSAQAKALRSNWRSKDG